MYIIEQDCHNYNEKVWGEWAPLSYSCLLGLKLRFVLTKNEEDNYEVILVQPVIKNDRLMCTGIDSDNVKGGFGFMANGGNSMVGATNLEIAKCLSRVLKTKGIFKI